MYGQDEVPTIEATRPHEELPNPAFVAAQTREMLEATRRDLIERRDQTREELEQVRKLAAASASHWQQAVELLEQRLTMLDAAVPAIEKQVRVRA